MKTRYKVLLAVIGLFLVLALILGSSYAIYLTSEHMEESIASSDCFEIELNGINEINLENAVPLSEEEGSLLTPYTFTIKNKCNHAADYVVDLETLEGSTMSENVIRYSINDEYSQILSESSIVDNPIYPGAISAREIDFGSMKSNSQVTYTLRIWIDEDSTIDQSSNKIFSSKIGVVASLNRNYTEAILANGATLNVKMKELAGATDPTIHTNDNVIKNFAYSDIAPGEGINYVNVADETSDKPIYIWFDTDTIYMYCENDLIYLNQNAARLFNRFLNVKSIDLSRFDTSRVTNMSYMFYGCNTLPSLNLENFNTYNVTDMGYMFCYSFSFKTLDLSSFNTSNVTNMTYMFYDVNDITSLNLSNFDTSKVTNMKAMFGSMDKLEQLEISSFDTSNVTTMESMFSDDKKLTSINIEMWETAKVENMSKMFNKCSSLRTIFIGNNWTTASVSNSENMFLDCTLLSGIAGTSYDPNHIDAEYARLDKGTSSPGYFCTNER